MSEARWTPRRAILLGGLVAGLLDISYAFLLWGLRGVPPVRILQSVAGGLLGADVQGRRRHGGSRRGSPPVDRLRHRCGVRTREPAAAGPRAPARPLGAALRYQRLPLVMNYVVLPLSAFPSRGGTPAPVVWITGVLAHMFLIGLPIALAARRAAPAER